MLTFDATVSIFGIRYERIDVVNHCIIFGYIHTALFLRERGLAELSTNRKIADC